MTAPPFTGLPDVDSELFEQVTDDELALLDYYRALQPSQRAAVLEALVRMVEPVREAQQRQQRGRTDVFSPAARQPSGGEHRLS